MSTQKDYRPRRAGKQAWGEHPEQLSSTTSLARQRNVKEDSMIQIGLGQGQRSVYAGSSPFSRNPGQPGH
jgi:hypothetical protein